MGMKIGNIDVSGFKLGTADATIYLGDTKMWPESQASPKIKLNYTGGTSYSAECDSSSDLLSSETRPNGYNIDAVYEAEIGSCVTTIGRGAFRYFINMSSVTIPNSVTTIGFEPFSECSGLTSVYIPDSVTSIDQWAFNGNRSLTSIHLPSGLTVIPAHLLGNAISLTSLEIPSGVTSIGEEAFAGCSALTSLTIPSRVTSIGNTAFRLCSSLNSITVEATTPPTLGSDVFLNTNDCPIYVPCGTLSAYQSAWSQYSSRIQETGCVATYVFTWGDSSTSKTETYAASTTGASLSLVSTKDGVYQDYTVTSYPNWITGVTKNSGSSQIEFAWDENQTSTANTGTVVLTQDESLDVIQLSVTQSASAQTDTRYLHFDVLDDNFSFGCRNQTIYYSTDTISWTSLSAYNTSPSFNSGDTIYLKAEKSATFLQFYAIGRFNAAGYPASMLYGDSFKENLSGVTSKCFMQMFWGCSTLIDASGLIMPATSLTNANECYRAMFSGCTSLTAAPTLPATTLSNYCYAYMFYGCMPLTAAPELPATTLAQACYEAMFQGCSGLTTPPSTLSATTMEMWACNSMFAGCKSLTTTPSLPATRLKKGSYNSMFQGCTGLTTAPALPATTLEDSCYKSMFQGCTSLTTAPALSATTLATSCYDRMFFGCTNLTTAPELPASRMANKCYSEMFVNCSHITTAPVLSATTLAQECYGKMFQNCARLTTAPELPATTLANYCYKGMFQGCTSLTTATFLKASTIPTSGYAEMFVGCTSLTTAPALPATTLGQNCYNSMFSGCTNLATAPTLPATTLANFCYYQMFKGCSNLTSVTCLATNISASNCTANWVSGVSATGTFTKAAGMTGWTTSISGIPNGWTVIDADWTDFSTIVDPTDNYNVLPAYEDKEIYKLKVSSASTTDFTGATFISTTGVSGTGYYMTKDNYDIKFYQYVNGINDIILWSGDISSNDASLDLTSLGINYLYAEDWADAVAAELYLYMQQPNNS